MSVYISKIDKTLYYATKPIEELNGRKAEFISGDISKGRYGKDLYEVPESFWNHNKIVIMEPIKPESMANWFSGTITEKIDGLDKIDTSDCIDMSRAFYRCSSLKELDLSQFRTDKVKSIESIFESCLNLRDVKVSTWNTENIENMRNAFAHDFNIKSLDLSNWDTRNCKNMTDMLGHCSALENLKISSKFEAKETQIFGVFHCCSKMIEQYGDNDKEIISKLAQSNNEKELFLKDLEKLKAEGHLFTGTLMIREEEFKVSIDTQTQSCNFYKENSNNQPVKLNQAESQTIQTHASEIKNVVYNALEERKDAIFIKDLTQLEQDKFAATLVLMDKKIKLEIDAKESKCRYYQEGADGKQIALTNSEIEAIKTHQKEIGTTIRTVMERVAPKKTNTLDDLLKNAKERKAIKEQGIQNKPQSRENER